MAIKLDDLEIDIQVNSLRAQSNIDLIAKSLKEAGNSGSNLKKIVAALQDVGNASADTRTETERVADSIRDAGAEADTAKPSIRSAAKELKNMGNSSAHATSKLAELFSSFKRIAMYRAMRSAIKAITNAFAEGVGNIKEWDLLIANTSYANQTMNTLKATTTQLANTLGALAIPILQLAIPALQALVNAVMEVANFFNQIIRAFQGYGTYIKATALSIEDMTDSMGKATGSAKELKRVLFGFDELNILPDIKKGSGGAGSGVLWDYADMFKEVEIENTLAAKIGNALKHVKDRIASSPAVQTMWDGLKMSVSGVGETMANLLMADFNGAWEGLKKTWTGFTFVVEGFKKFKLIEYINAYLINPVNGFISALTSSFDLFFNFIIDPRNWFKKGAWEQTKNEISGIWTNYFDTVVSGINKLNQKTIKPKTEVDTSPIEKFRNDVATLKDGSKSTITIKTQLKPLTQNDVNNVAKGAQLDAKRLAPITLSTALYTSGLPAALARAYELLQNGANKAPITFATGLSLSVPPISTTFAAKSSLANIAMASGGLVPNVGSLIWAGEAGAEVVADMGTHTGVMNVNQMQAAVAEGNVEVVNAIYAMANLIASEVRGKNFDVYMDSAKVGKSVSDYQYNQARRGIVQGGMA